MDNCFSDIYIADQMRSQEDPSTLSIFDELFVTRSPLLLQALFPALEAAHSDGVLEAKVVPAYQRQQELERRHLHEAIRDAEALGRSCIIEKAKLATLDARPNVDSLDAFLAMDDALWPGVRELRAERFQLLQPDEDATAYVNEHSHMFAVGSLLYEEYLYRRGLLERFRAPFASKLEAIFTDKGVDLSATDPQFSKYRLLSLNSELRIVNERHFQALSHEGFGLYFGIEVPSLALSAIDLMRGEGHIPGIAFAINSASDVRPSFEALEFGKAFHLTDLQAPSMSKFYGDSCYEDALWIKVERNPPSMTFEELRADLRAMDGQVVTQVVHLQFSGLTGQELISHIDHEYILYPEAEYVRRRNDPSIKGIAKYKTFKIDGASIPLDHRVGGHYFLYLVLDAFFENKGLIREYFGIAGEPDSAS